MAGMEAHFGLTAQLPLGKVHLAAAAADYLTAPSLYMSANSLFYSEDVTMGSFSQDPLVLLQNVMGLPGLKHVGQTLAWRWHLAGVKVLSDYPEGCTEPGH